MDAKIHQNVIYAKYFVNLTDSRKMLANKSMM